MKAKFPKLIDNDSISFQFEFCGLAKHAKSTYPSNSYKPTRPFSLIHSDIQGPLKVPNIMKSRWPMTLIDVHTYDMGVLDERGV